jgi:hypothetical protein
MALTFAVGHFAEGILIFVLLSINAVIRAVQSRNSQRVGGRPLEEQAPDEGSDATGAAPGLSSMRRSLCPVTSSRCVLGTLSRLTPT